MVRRPIEACPRPNALAYVSLTTLIGVAGIYTGLRGTLTAGFVFPEETMRTFLMIERCPKKANAADLDGHAHVAEYVAACSKL